MSATWLVMGILRPRTAAAWGHPPTLTEEAAAKFAKLALWLRDRGHDPRAVAHFINRLIFCMFAESVDLLPNRCSAE